MNVFHIRSKCHWLLLFFSTFTATATEDSSRTFLRPLGEIAQGQQEHLSWVILLMAIAVLPVFIATPWIYFRYRYTKRSSYQPEWSYNRYLEYALWGVPVLIVMALSFHLWKSTHSDDPYQAIPGNEAPLCVQVIGLNWQWLFLYPQYHTASLNQLIIPTNRPVSLKLTSDTVMQSFRISALAGQIYTMPGMQTQLHFSAFRPGSAWGENTQFNGDGFAKQHFLVNAVSAATFEAWQQSATEASLTEKAYAVLGQPKLAFVDNSLNVAHYSGYPQNLFERVMQRYHTDKALADIAQPGSASYVPEAATLPSLKRITHLDNCSTKHTTTKEHPGE